MSTTTTAAAERPDGQATLADAMDVIRAMVADQLAADADDLQPLD